MICVLFNGLFLLFVAHGTANPVLLDSNHQELTFQADLSGRCPPGYSQPDNSNWPYCYQVNSDSQTPKDAATKCKSANGSLASVPSSLVNSFIYYLATQVDASSVWLGVECFNGDKTSCMNNDGAKFNYSNFKTGQPDPSDNCVYLSTAGRDSQQWFTFDCQQTFAYVCETSAVNPTACPNNYTEFQGTCYRFIDLGGHTVTGTNASAECRKIPGGNLATVANNATNTFLTNLEKKAGYPGNLGSGPVNAFGLRCSNVRQYGDTSSCNWDDGTPFSYSAFKPNFPGFGENGFCSFRLGVWYGCNAPNSSVFTSYFCQAPTSYFFQAPKQQL